MTKKLMVATVINHGGREGEVESVNGSLNLKTTMTKKEGFSNPEELFAAGISACFNGALSFPLERDGLGERSRKVRAEVSLLGDLPDFTTLHLAVTLIASIDGLTHDEVLKYMQETEQICPYTKAVQGNIELTLVGE
ncbi:MAG: Ohr family peroxiredoxin [Enterococcus sp.]